MCFVSYNTALTYTCCDTCCFFKCLFILVCRSKSPTELMFHAVLYLTQNTLSMSMSKRRICVYRSINTFTSFRDHIMCLSMFEDLDSRNQHEHFFQEPGEQLSVFWRFVEVKALHGLC